MTQIPTTINGYLRELARRLEFERDEWPPHAISYQFAQHQIDAIVEHAAIIEGLCTGLPRAELVSRALAIRDAAK
jgi:hypothetical protein